MRSFVSGAIAAAMLALPWTAISYAGLSIAGLPFIPFALFDWLVRMLPGQVITLALETMVGGLQALDLGSTAALGKAFEAGIALAITAIGLAALGGAQALLGGKTRVRGVWSGGLAGMLLWASGLRIASFAGWGEAGMLAAILWLALVSVGWGLAAGWAGEQLLETGEAPPSGQRRQFIRNLGFSSIALGGLAIGLGRWFSSRQEQIETVTRSSSVEGVAIVETPTPSGFRPVDGTRPEITAMRDFYRVDINLLPPSQGQVSAESAGSLAEILRAQGDSELDIGGEGYLLIVDGLVDGPLTLTSDQLRDLPRARQYATLECISNRVGGDLIGTTEFAGVPLREVLNRAGLRSDAVDVKFTCGDGYTESLPIESAMDGQTLLCYAMGGQILPQAHGAPLRLYTPDRFGQKNPKWIIRVEVIGEDYRGYWPQRGWSEEAWVQTTTVIDAARSPRPGVVECGGIAFAGARGIREVGVQIDDGEWISAELKPPLSPLTWVLWRSSLEAAAGKHRLSVRAVDGTGELQSAESSPPQPGGATGYHSLTVTVK